MNNSLVSVITPLHNCEEYIAETINSIQSQTYKNWEMIIIDDCSDDKSVCIVEEFLLKDKRIRLLRNDNNYGSGKSRNIGIENANGRYIAFCDSDDLWKKDKLVNQIKFMQDNNCALSYTSYDVMDEVGNPKGNVNVLPKVTYNSMLKSNYIGCLTAVYDTKKLGKVYMPEIRKRQDWALWLKILKKTDIAYGINDNLAVYRDRSSSLSSNKIDLLKYNWAIYKDVEKFSYLESIFYLGRFLFYYFIKRMNK